MTNNVEAAAAMCETLWRDLLEKDDRTSPAEYPNMALITFEEFSAAIDAVRTIPLPDPTPDVRDVALAKAREALMQIANGSVPGVANAALAAIDALPKPAPEQKGQDNE